MKGLSRWAASAAVATLTVFAGTAYAGEGTTVTVLDKCRNAVNSLGASMGHTEVKGPDGRPAYLFILRTSGPDYEAMCDAETGIIGDVTPRLGRGSADAS